MRVLNCKIKWQRMYEYKKPTLTALRCEIDETNIETLD